MQSFRTKPIVVLAVLLLAALQLSAASHQFDHAVNDFGEVCSYCVQLDRLDDVSPTSDIESVSPRFVAAGFEFGLPQRIVRASVFSQPRAPPHS